MYRRGCIIPKEKLDVNYRHRRQNVFPAVIAVVIIEHFRSRVIRAAACKGRGERRVFGEEYVASMDRCAV